MIKQGFKIQLNSNFARGDSWYIMAFYNIKTNADLVDVKEVLIASGAESENVNRAIENLKDYNSGYTFSNFKERNSVVCASKATSFDELFNTITHEIKHLTEHISESEGIDPKSEDAASLQGKIAMNMYKAVAIAICPKCNNIKNNFINHGF